jgi:hypothetical protein
MGERLREVADQAAAGLVALFRQQPDIVAQPRQALVAADLISPTRFTRRAGSGGLTLPSSASWTEAAAMDTSMAWRAHRRPQA